MSVAHIEHQEPLVDAPREEPPGARIERDAVRALAAGKRPGCLHLERMRVDALYGAAIDEVHIQLAGAVRRRELWFTAELDARGNRVRACVDRGGHLGVAVHHEHPLAEGIVDHAVGILVRRESASGPVSETGSKTTMACFSELPAQPLCKTRRDRDAVRSRDRNLADDDRAVGVHHRHRRLMCCEDPMRCRVPGQIVPPVGRSERDALNHRVETCGGRCGVRRSAGGEAQAAAPGRGRGKGEILRIMGDDESCFDSS